MNRHISICIPTYEMKGHGRAFLSHSFNVLVRQTFTDFDVIISDHSQNNEIEMLCATYAGKLDIHYYRNEKDRGNSSANLNNAITHATGLLIKILFQDDFLYDEHALAHIAEQFNLEEDTWLVTASEHSKDGVTFYKPFYPHYSDDIFLGHNTISSPSVLTIKNITHDSAHQDGVPLFDTHLKWLMDCDYYARCHDRFGKPKILNAITVVNRVGAHQVTETISEQIKVDERAYMIEKRKTYQKRNITLPHVTLVAVSSVRMPETVRALKQSMSGITFGKVLLISDQKPTNLPTGITYVHCEPIRSIDEYSKFMLYDLARYIDTDFALVAQYDGFVLRPEIWTDEFLNYDYIGAPWAAGLYTTTDKKNVRVGNGGFSLRSKKLLNAFNDLHLPFTDQGSGFYNEDGAICVYHRKELEKHSIRYARVPLASLFSRETDCADSESAPFGFHKNTKNIPRLFFVTRWWKKLF